MLTVDVNFIRPNKGILIPPGEENEYFEDIAIVLRSEMELDCSIPSPVLNFLVFVELDVYEPERDNDRHNLKLIDSSGE